MDNNFELKILNPADLAIFRAGGLVRMTIGQDSSIVRLNITRAYPLSDPTHYYGLLNGDGKDVGMIVDPEGLNADSRAVVEEELEKRYFVPVVESVIDVKEDFGAVVWKVQTSRGEKQFVVRGMRDNLAELSASRVLLTDVDGNRYEFPDINLLDSRSFDLIMRNL